MLLHHRYRIGPDVTLAVLCCSIIGTYTTFVLVIGRLCRTPFVDISYHIMFDELPYVDRILQVSGSAPPPPPAGTSLAGEAGWGRSRGTDYLLLKSSISNQQRSARCSHTSRTVMFPAQKLIVTTRSVCVPRQGGWKGDSSLTATSIGACTERTVKPPPPPPPSSSGRIQLNCRFAYCEITCTLTDRPPQKAGRRPSQAPQRMHVFLPNCTSDLRSHKFDLPFVHTLGRLSTVADNKWPRCIVYIAHIFFSLSCVVWV